MNLWMVYLVNTLVLISVSYAEKEETIPVSDTAVGTECDNDINVARTCLVCSRLHRDIAVQLTDCCSEDKAFIFCEVCTKNPDKCLAETRSIDKLGSTEENEGADVDKRYGSLFMGSGRFGKRFADDEGMDKRFGSLFMGSGKFGKRFPDDADIDKRYGTMFMGSGKFGKREDENVDKRYGSLFMGSGKFGKRFGEEEDDDSQDVDKRYGRLFMGSGRYGKRFGRLFFGNSGSWYGRYGKRSDLMDGENNIQDLNEDEVDKRDTGGESSNMDAMSDIDKRYGRLFMSGGGYGWYGNKRFRNLGYRGRANP